MQQDAVKETVRQSAPPVAAVVAFLVIGDLLVLYGALFLAVFIRKFASQWFPIVIGSHVFAGMAMAALLLPLAYGVAGLYPGYGLTGVERLRKRVRVSCLCFGSMILFDYLAQNGQWSRGVLLVMAAFSVLAIPVWDALARYLLVRWSWWGEGVVVLGPERQRRQLVSALARHPELGWIPAAEFEPAAAGCRVPDISLALVALSHGSLSAPPWTDDLPYSRVVLVPEPGDMQSLWVSVRDLGAHFGLEMRRNLLIPWNQAIKRVLDLLFGTVALVIVAPLVAMLALLVFVVSPGPVFFSHIRDGLDNRPFRMWKLRTMQPGADAMLTPLIAASEEAQSDWNHSMKIRNDPRIIPVLGHFMRRYSIDELPQLWNVVRGDMSLVGPRPLPHYHLARFDPLTQQVRRRVRPGITGLWQVSGRSSLPLAEQQRHDIYYVRNWSLWLDLHILGRTVLVVLGGKGAW